MKSAYQLAMERLEKAAPSISLTEDQKNEIAEVDSVYRAKIAEREVFLKDQIRKAQIAGNLEEAQSLEKQPIVDSSVAAYPPGDRFIGICTIMPIVAVEITEAVTQIPEGQEIKNHEAPVEQEHYKKRGRERSQLKVAPE